MADIDSMLDDILTREGGYVNNPGDRGGPTNYGITQATLSTWLGRPASVEDVQNLDPATAKAIYAKNYYTGPRLDQLPDLIQPVMLDAAVNSGPPEAVKWLQQVINDNGHGPVTVDGGVGPATETAAAATASAMGKDLNRALIEARRAFMRELGVERPADEQFENGWMARCNALEAQYC